MPKPLEDTFGLVGSTLENKIRLDRVVAQGGFSLIYAGRHLVLDVPVALKVPKFPKEFSDAKRAEFAEKFVFEARTVAKLQHSAIVRILDAGLTTTNAGPTAFMVLEWLDGHTLGRVLLNRRNKGGQSARAVLHTLRPVFDALALAHEKGVAHRDIKPTNIMIVDERRSSTCKVLDFGIAKIMANDEDVGSGFTGTVGISSAFSPQYAAPEQVGGMRSGPWTDVHAVGLIMTEMLVDQAPYAGRMLAELVQETLSPLRATPAKFGRDAGPLEAVLQKALAFKPEERYRDAGEMLAAVENAVAWMGQAPTASSAVAPWRANDPRVGGGSGTTTQWPNAQPIGATNWNPSMAPQQPSVTGAPVARIVALVVVTLGTLAGGGYGWSALRHPHTMTPRAPPSAIGTLPTVQQSLSVRAAAAPPEARTAAPPDTPSATPDIHGTTDSADSTLPDGGTVESGPHAGATDTHDAPGRTHRTGRPGHHDTHYHLD